MVYLHIFTYIWVIFMINVGKYTIHGSYGLYIYIQLHAHTIMFAYAYVHIKGLLIGYTYIIAHWHTYIHTAFTLKYIHYNHICLYTRCFKVCFFQYVTMSIWCFTLWLWNRQVLGDVRRNALLETQGSLLGDRFSKRIHVLSRQNAMNIRNAWNISESWGALNKNV